MNTALQPDRCSRRRKKRIGAASLELVLATAVMLPLSVILLLLGIKICRYVFAALSGMTQMPFL